MVILLHEPVERFSWNLVTDTSWISFLLGRGEGRVRVNSELHFGFSILICPACMYHRISAIFYAHCSQILSRYFHQICYFQVELVVSNVSVFSGGSIVLSRSIVRGTSSQDGELEFKVTSHPKAGWIALDTWNLANITSLSKFTSSQLNDHRVSYVNNPSTHTKHDSFLLAVCSSSSRCSESKQINVLIKQRNVHG